MHVQEIVFISNINLSTLHEHHINLLENKNKNEKYNSLQAKQI